VTFAGIQFWQLIIRCQQMSLLIASMKALCIKAIFSSLS